MSAMVYGSWGSWFLGKSRGATGYPVIGRTGHRLRPDLHLLTKYFRTLGRALQINPPHSAPTWRKAVTSCFTSLSGSPPAPTAATHSARCVTRRVPTRQAVTPGAKAAK